MNDNGTITIYTIKRYGVFSDGMMILNETFEEGDHGSFNYVKNPNWESEKKRQEKNGNSFVKWECEQVGSFNA